MEAAYQQIMKTTSDGIELALYHWPVPEPKAVVVLTHGLAGYALRYEELAAHLQTLGLAVVGVDLRGHGHSTGLRAYVKHFSQYLSDFSVAVDYAESLYPELPRFIFTHSMGSVVSAYYLLDHGDQIAGAVLMGIALYATDSVPSFLVKLSGVVSAVWPKFPASKINASLTSSQEGKAQAYIDDPLIYSGGIRARTGYTLMTHANEIIDRTAEIKTPLLLLHGENDVICNPRGSKHLMEHARSVDKTLKIYPGLYHELLNEKEAPAIMQEIGEWFTNRLA